MVVLTVVVLLFELDLRISGGLEVLTQSSRFYDTVLMDLSIYIHLFFSVTTAVIWIVLIILSLRRYVSPPKPDRVFSPTHKLWGKIGMIWMIAIGITGLELYLVGFAL